jgi:hypothetical protein
VFFIGSRVIHLDMTVNFSLPMNSGDLKRLETIFSHKILFHMKVANSTRHDYHINMCPF